MNVRAGRAGRGSLVGFLAPQSKARRWSVVPSASCAARTSELKFRERGMLARVMGMHRPAETLLATGLLRRRRGQFMMVVLFCQPTAVVTGDSPVAVLPAAPTPPATGTCTSTTRSSSSRSQKLQQRALRYCWWMPFVSGGTTLQSSWALVVPACAARAPASAASSPLGVNHTSEYLSAPPNGCVQWRCVHPSNSNPR